MYTVLADALVRVRERSGARDVDNPYLTELLNLSAGVAPDQTIHFRVFYVSAKFLEQSRTIQAIKIADGATFTGQALPIASLLNQQLAYDTALELTIPPGFEATPPIEASTSNRIQRFGTRSQTSQVRS